MNRNQIREVVGPIGVVVLDYLYEKYPGKVWRLFRILMLVSTLSGVIVGIVATLFVQMLF